MALYKWVVGNERLDQDRAARDLGLGRDEVDAALATLTELGLLKADADDPARLRPVDPDLVAAVVTTSLEETIRAQQSELHRIRDQFASLRGHYRDSLSRASVGLEVIPGLAEVRAALNRASAECTEEMLTSQPGGNRVPAALQEALARDTALLSRGVRMRTLYHHTARFNGPSQAYVSMVSGLGAEYRTAHELFGRLIVFDRRVAFIPEQSGNWGAVVIREPSVVHYLCEIFEQYWTHAEPFSDAVTDGLEAVAKDIDRTIVRLLASGMKDETIARRLGMSLRTARKHIADVMETLGAESRFQAGVLSARLGLLGDEGGETAPSV
ncbi:helix-turn-helix transcriptional regulator [Streptomyces sp. GC420]|uniref:helix-turn-helix transcriptional regulator n=1 Tax=Streptomyces sp. GC420 TaxID=2697568 RepID=UPI0028BEF427|nr:helix-turn-helix transcriptional regulator [Streptomyces sp. GC420]